MHRFSLLLILVLSTCSRAFAEESFKRVPSFMVVSSEKDPTLKKTEAVFEFEFTNPEFNDQTEQWPEIQSSYNGQLHPFKLGPTLTHTLKVAPGKYLFQFYATSYYYEIYSDSVEIKPGYRTKVQLRFDYAEQEIIVDKPVIYLYPPHNLQVSVAVQPKGAFTFTYPVYSNGWTGTAHPDGSMTIGKSTYPYLFWEAKNTFSSSSVDWNSGFIVPAENTVSFLEARLSEMGLNALEQTDFITYWGPKMAGNASNFVHFLFNEDCNQFAELNIEPQPAQLFRIYMVWASAEAGTVVTPQIMQTVNREQFYAIEWGGSELQPILTSSNH